ncbi:MAG: HEAT repeat domain-containing protein [Planctomycetes bacterium]|nr:HEAT repeat domain-containing protein [Planctomycetota bacterium]
MTVRKVMMMAAALVLALSAAADNVYLTNGKVYRRVRARRMDDGRVEITIAGGTMILQQEQVAYIEKEEVPEEELKGAGEPELSPVLRAIAEKVASKTADTGKGGKPSQEEKQAKSFLALLKDPDEGVRAQGAAALAGMGNAAVPYLVEALGDKNNAYRYQVSKVLYEIRPRQAIKPMLEAMYAASPEQGPAPHFLQQYLVNLRNTLRATTGQQFNYQPDLASQAAAMKKWVEWYEKNWEKLPEQMTDPKIEKDDPEYKKKFEEGRKLNLARRAFTPDSLAGAAGRER